MRNIILTAIILSCCGAAPAFAHSIYGPYVEKGVLEAEVRGERVIGGDEDGDSETTWEVGYGVSDRLHLGLVAEVEDEPGEERTMEAIGLEAITYLGQIPGTGVDVGAYLEYEQRLHNESGIVEGKLLLARRFGPVEGLLNLIAEQPLTDRDGEGAMEFGYAAQGTVEAMDDLEIGLLGIGELGTNRDFGGRQEHWLGPVADWELEHLGIPGELEFEAAYLFPLGSARDEADGQVRFTLEYERDF